MVMNFLRDSINILMLFGMEKATINIYHTNNLPYHEYTRIIFKGSHSTCLLTHREHVKPPLG